MITQLDVSYDQEHEICKLDMYLPDKEQYPTIIFFHGGGLETGSRKTKFDVEAAQTYAENGVGYILVEYRMYSHGAKYPDFLEDADKAVHFVASYMKKIGNGGSIYIAGSSAGAWMSLMLCLRNDYLKDVAVDGWLIESPQTTSHFNVIKNELGCDPRVERIDEFAPLFYVGPDTTFSKMLLFFYDKDIPCRYEQNMLFIKSVKRFYPQVDLEYVVLPGTHTQGSEKKDEDGQYPVTRHSLDWLRRKGVI